MAFGGDERDLCALALQQRIGCNRGAMNQPVGGGGWGPPDKRSEEARQRDRAQGLLTELPAELKS